MTTQAEAETVYVFEVTTNNGTTQSHRHPRPPYTGDIPENIKEELLAIVDGMNGKKSSIALSNPFVIYRSKAITKVTIKIEGANAAEVAPEQSKIGFLINRDQS